MKEFFKDLKTFGTLPKRRQLLLGLLIISGVASFDFISRANRDPYQPSVKVPAEMVDPAKTATLQIRPDTLQGAVIRHWQMAIFTPSPAPSPDAK